MMRCDACEIDIEGTLDRCPLCGAPLTGTPTPDPFPSVARVRQGFRASSVLAAVTAALWVVLIPLVLANLLRPLAAVAIAGALLANYIFLRNVLLHATNFLRMIERYFFVLLAMALLAYIATGSQAISCVVLPMLCIVALASNSVLLALFRGAFVEGYAKYLIMDMVLGALPLLMVAFGQVDWPWLAVASALLAALMLAVLLMGSHGKFANESRKLFDRG